MPPQPDERKDAREQPAFNTGEGQAPPWPGGAEEDFAPQLLRWRPVLYITANVLGPCPEHGFYIHGDCDIIGRFDGLNLEID
jgi:hypothetical protein